MKNEEVKLPVLAGLHALFALSKQMGLAGEALVAALSDTRLTGVVARSAFLLRLILVIARRAFRYAGAICRSECLA